MKYNYSFNAELISNKQFTEDELDTIKTELELREEFSQFYTLFKNSVEINFNKYAEIYIEDIPFELDLSSDIEKMIDTIDSIIPGGWSADSKIEFYSEFPHIITIWYKEGKTWKESSMNSPREDFLPGAEWDETDEGWGSDSYSDYDGDPDW